MPALGGNISDRSNIPTIHLTRFYIAIVAAALFASLVDPIHCVTQLVKILATKKLKNITIKKF